MSQMEATPLPEKRRRKPTDKLMQLNEEAAAAAAKQPAPRPKGPAGAHGGFSNCTVLIRSTASLKATGSRQAKKISATLPLNQVLQRNALAAIPSPDPPTSTRTGQPVPVAPVPRGIALNLRDPPALRTSAAPIRPIRNLPARARAVMVPDIVPTDVPASRVKPVSATTSIRGGMRQLSVNAHGAAPAASEYSQPQVSFPGDPHGLFDDNTIDTTGSTSEAAAAQGADAEEFEMDEDPEAAFEEEEPAGGSYYSEDYDEAYQADEDDDIPQPAPGGGRKRGRSLSTQVLDYTRAPVPRRENGHTGRPRRKDYDEESRTTIAGAQARFGCFLVTENAFPDRATEIEQSVSCWDDECRESGVLLRITPEIIKMITREGSHLRGEIKTKARPHVYSIFGFDSAMNAQAIADNRRCQETYVKEGAYKYAVELGQDLSPHKLWKARVFQATYNDAFFSNRNGLGVLFPEQFSAGCVPALALIVTTVKHCLDEWVTGSRAVDRKFTAREYAKIYQNNVADIMKFGEATKASGALEKILRKMLETGRTHAGLDPVSDNVDADRIPDEVFEAAARAPAAGYRDSDDEDDSMDFEA